jgi:hypothetical protein
MSLVNISLSTHVHFQDGAQGTLYRMVVQPATCQVTDLVVRRGILRKHMWVLPIALVNFVNSDGVFVAINSTQLDAYPAYREYDREVPIPNFDKEPQNPSLRMIIWMPHYGLFEESRPFTAVIPMHIREGIPTNLKAIGGNTHVQCISGEVGKLDHLVVDTETWQVVELIVHKRMQSKDLVVPKSWIAAVDETSITVWGTGSQLQQLHRYQSRPEDEILLKLRKWFDEAPYDYHDVLPIVEDGILHLHGVVENEAARHHAEMIGRSIPGIFLVENRLETSTAVTSQVTAVLRGDDQSEPAPPLPQA